jgi:hypothetical protein
MEETGMKAVDLASLSSSWEDAKKSEGRHLQERPSGVPRDSDWTPRRGRRSSESPITTVTPHPHPFCGENLREVSVSKVDASVKRRPDGLDYRVRV